MSIRHAVEYDLPRIVEIYNAAIPTRSSTADTETVSVASRKAWFFRHEPDRRPLLVYEQQGRLIGKRLLQKAEELAPALGLRSLVGYVFAHNTRSMRLLSALGYQEWGRLPDIAEMDGKEYTLCIMGKRLDIG